MGGARPFLLLCLCHILKLKNKVLCVCIRYLSVKLVYLFISSNAWPWLKHSGQKTIKYLTSWINTPPLVSSYHLSQFEHSSLLHLKSLTSAIKSTTRNISTHFGTCFFLLAISLWTLASFFLDNLWCMCCMTVTFMFSEDGWSVVDRGESTPVWPSSTYLRRATLTPEVHKQLCSVHSLQHMDSISIL